MIRPHTHTNTHTHTHIPHCSQVLYSENQHAIFIEKNQGAICNQISSLTNFTIFQQMTWNYVLMKKKSQQVLSN